MFVKCSEPFVFSNSLNAKVSFSKLEQTWKDMHCEMHLQHSVNPNKEKYLLKYEMEYLGWVSGQKKKAVVGPKSRTPIEERNQLIRQKRKWMPSRKDNKSNVMLHFSCVGFFSPNIFEPQSPQMSSNGMPLWGIMWNQTKWILGIDHTITQSPSGYRVKEPVL